MAPLENQYIMCWDTGRNPDRVALYPDYKIPQQDEETHIDRQAVSEECRILERAVMATPIATAVGYPGPSEGDDIIYSIVSDVSRMPGWTCVVVSDDSDLLQMFSEFQFILYSPQRRLAVKNSDEASDILGYPCDRIVFYKALCGDPSDRIPGLDGIGKTSAFQVVSRYRDAQEFLSASVDSIGAIKRVGSRLLRAREHPEILARNMDLIRLRKVGYQLLDGSRNPEALTSVLRPIGLSFFRSHFSQYM
jgi:5'-3' exonuclease